MFYGGYMVCVKCIRFLKMRWLWHAFVRRDINELIYLDYKACTTNMTVEQLNVQLEILRRHPQRLNYVRKVHHVLKMIESKQDPS